MRGVVYMDELSNLEIAVISAIISAIFTYVFTKVLNTKPIQVEFKWTIYNHMVDDLYQSRYILADYVNELSRFLTYFEATKSQWDSEESYSANLELNFDKLNNYCRQFLEKRNHFLMYSKMYQEKYNYNTKKYGMTLKKHKEFVEYLIECNDIFHSDWDYIQKCYCDLLEIKQRLSAKSYVTSGFQDEFIEVINNFKGNDLLITDISEIPLQKYMSKTIRKYI